MTAPLTAELIARALIASAVSYGDDPIRALSAQRGQLRRCIAPAAVAVHEAVGCTLERVGLILGLGLKNLYTVRNYPKPAFTLAKDAAREAVDYHLRGLELSARGQARAEPACCEATADHTEIDLRNPAGETIPSSQGGARAAEAMTGDSPVASAPTITPAARPAPSRPAPKPAAQSVARNTGRAMPRGAKFENLGEGVSVIRLKPITDSVVRHAAAQVARGADIEDLADLFSVDVEHLRRRLNAGAAA